LKTLARYYLSIGLTAIELIGAFALAKLIGIDPVVGVDISGCFLITIFNYIVLRDLNTEE